MKKVSLILLLSALTLGPVTQLQAQQQDRSAIEHELAVTAYNYAVGCELRDNYDEALVGLSHIPAGQLTVQQQAWADTLRIKCEAMAGHPMAQTEVQLAEGELLAIDDQSDAFIQGIHYYKAANYYAAGQKFNEVIDMGEGPRPQVAIEAIFWRGQCLFQLQQWDACCQDLILFNDTKNSATAPLLDAMAYYTMGYARMHAKKWHQARLNFERYLDHETDKARTTYADGQQRLQECRRLENGSASTYRQPLDIARLEPTAGETIEIENAVMIRDTQTLRDKESNARARIALRDWHAPFIEE